MNTKIYRERRGFGTAFPAYFCNRTFFGRCCIHSPGVKGKYEIFHGVRITEGALNAAVVLSYRYITDRFLPDKAIDLIDEAASLIRMQIGSLPLPIDEKERELSALIVKQEAIKREQAPAYQEEAEDMQKQLTGLRKSWPLYACAGMKKKD